jgi:eukaryotic-like serine/threonine-protein kinase
MDSGSHCEAGAARGASSPALERRGELPLTAPGSGVLLAPTFGRSLDVQPDGIGALTYQNDPWAGTGVREGETLAGKYRLERILGVGGMGVVVAAHHIHLDIAVAIKVLRPEMLDSPESVARFTREARAAVRIKSEHVARVFDVGVLDTGTPFMVMEVLEGSDLASWLEERGPLPVEQAVDFVLQACLAVAEAHKLEMVHRDLKPSNLFCVPAADGRFIIKVLDFGISKVASLGAITGRATKTGDVIGSPFYMSPEQMRSSKDVDARSDIWSLGIVLYELLTGRVPFTGETIPELVLKLAMHPPESLRSFRPEVPAGLEAVFQKCTEKRGEERYQNVAELAVALQPYAASASRPLVDRVTRILQAPDPSTDAVVVAAPSTPPGSARATTDAGLGRTASGPPRPWRVDRVAGAGLAGAATLAAAFVTVWRLHVPHAASLAPAAAVAAVEHAESPSATSPGAPSAAVELGSPALDSACVGNATRCAGPARETCVDRQWVRGAVVEGQCGAACTPDAARCGSPAMAMRCGAGGQWEIRPCVDGRTCRDGECRAAVPRAAASPNPVRTAPPPSALAAPVAAPASVDPLQVLQPKK